MNSVRVGGPAGARMDLSPQVGCGDPGFVWVDQPTKDF